MASPLMTTYAPADLAFERGDGAYLVTGDGERFLDFGGGIAVTVLGHAHPHLVRVLTDQAEKLWHTSNMYRIPGQERLAQRLVACSFADVAFFTNSGAEAVECAVKTARKFHFHSRAADTETPPYRIITFEGAFHGRTLTAISAAQKPAHIEGFEPLMPGFDQVPFDDAEATRNAITHETAAIMIEPIQGEGGIRSASWGFLQTLRDLCDEHGMLLIFDEVQTGIGRTGKMFAYERTGIVPDIMAIAKGLGGGFPVGACLATADAAKHMTPGSHGSTFGGNPLAMAVANGVLDIVLQDGFLDHVQTVGNRLHQGLAVLNHKFPRIFDSIRGEGLMIGLKCRVPNKDVIKAMISHKMLAAAAGDNVIRLLPPLIIGDAEIHEAIGRLEQACADIDHRLQQDEEQES